MQNDRRDVQDFADYYVIFHQPVEKTTIEIETANGFTYTLVLSAK